MHGCHNLSKSGCTFRSAAYPDEVVFFPWQVYIASDTLRGRDARCRMTLSLKVTYNLKTRLSHSKHKFDACTRRTSCCCFCYVTTSLTEEGSPFTCPLTYTGERSGDIQGRILSTVDLWVTLSISIPVHSTYTLCVTILTSQSSTEILPCKS